MDRKTLVNIFPLVITGLFWIFTMNGIPERVTALESDVKELKLQMAKSDAKTDIILEDVKFLKQVAVEHGRFLR